MVTRDPRRFEVWLTRLDPAIGSEMRKTRPRVVVSPDGMNKALNTAIFCPLTSRIRGWPSRVRVEFDGREGEVALDRCVFSIVPDSFGTWVVSMMTPAF